MITCAVEANTIVDNINRFWKEYVIVVLLVVVLSFTRAGWQNMTNYATKKNRFLYFFIRLLGAHGVHYLPSSSPSSPAAPAVPAILQSFNHLVRAQLPHEVDMSFRARGDDPGSAHGLREEIRLDLFSSYRHHRPKLGKGGKRSLKKQEAALAHVNSLGQLNTHVPSSATLDGRP